MLDSGRCQYALWRAEGYRIWVLCNLCSEVSTFKRPGCDAVLKSGGRNGGIVGEELEVGLGIDVLEVVELDAYHAFTRCMYTNAQQWSWPSYR